MNFAEFYREPPHIAELCSSRPSRMSYLCTVIQPCLPFSPIEVIYSDHPEGLTVMTGIGRPPQT